jgi:hypothetical protein
MSEAEIIRKWNDCQKLCEQLNASFKHELALSSQPNGSPPYTEYFLVKSKGLTFFECKDLEEVSQRLKALQDVLSHSVQKLKFTKES